MRFGSADGAAFTKNLFLRQASVVPTRSLDDGVVTISEPPSSLLQPILAECVHAEPRFKDDLSRSKCIIDPTGAALFTRSLPRALSVIVFYVGESTRAGSSKRRSLRGQDRTTLSIAAF